MFSLKFPMNHEFHLKARIRTNNHKAIRAVLKTLFPKKFIKEENNEFTVTTVMKGPSSRALNKILLSALRRIEKKTRIWAEWTSGNKTDIFFDDGIKKTEIINDVNRNN